MPIQPVLVSRRETASGITVSAYTSGGRPEGYVSPYLSADEAEELVHLDERGLPNLRIVEFRGEWWLAETSTGRLVNAGSRVLRRFGIWSVRVRGDEYAPGTLRIGPASLVREPDNQFDANAIAVYQDGVRCGYWNKGAARSLAKLLDSGQEMAAYAISAHPPKVIATEQRVLSQLVGKLRAIDTPGTRRRRALPISRLHGVTPYPAAERLLTRSKLDAGRKWRGSS